MIDGKSDDTLKCVYNGSDSDPIYKDVDGYDDDGDDDAIM